MAKYEEALENFKSKMDNLGIFYHEELYQEIIKYLGPSIYQKDAALVACSDPKELETIKKSFLIDKLGVTDGPELDEVIEEVCGAMGKSNRTKYRTTFYYLLVARLNKERIFIKQKHLPIYENFV